MARGLRILIASAAMTLLLAGPAGAGADESGDLRVSPGPGEDFRISGPSATASDIAESVVWNQTANEYLVVWFDERDIGTRGRDVYGRRIAADGVRLGEFRISGPNAIRDDEFPSAVWNQTGNEYLVVWQDDRNYSTLARGEVPHSWEIYGRRVGSNGKLVGADFRVSGPDTASSAAPVVAWNQTASEYLVVWTDRRNYTVDEFGADIYGRRVGADGKPVGADFLVITGAWEPALVWDQTANEYLVVWQDWRNALTRGSDIYGRRLGASGAPIGGDIRISGANATANERSPVVVWNQAANEYLVVWQDGRNVPTRSWEDIYGRRLGSDGKLVGGDLRISGPSSRPESPGPAVAWNQTANQYLVVWEDSRNWSTRRSDAYGRRLGSDGKPAGAEFRISGLEATSQDFKPLVTSNTTANQYLVVWSDGRSLARGMDVYGRLLAG